MKKPGPHRRRPPADTISLQVRREPLHELAEQRLTRLLERRRALAFKHATELAKPKTMARARRLHALEADDAAALRTIAKVRAELAPMRERHALALARHRASIAVHALNSLADLESAVADLGRAARGIRMAVGGSTVPIEMPDLTPLRAALADAVRTGRADG